MRPYYDRILVEILPKPPKPKAKKGEPKEPKQSYSSRNDENFKVGKVLAVGPEGSGSSDSVDGKGDYQPILAKPGELVLFKDDFNCYDVTNVLPAAPLFGGTAPEGKLMLIENGDVLAIVDLV